MGAHAVATSRCEVVVRGGAGWASLYRWATVALKPRRREAQGGRGVAGLRWKVPTDL